MMLYKHRRRPDGWLSISLTRKREIRPLHLCNSTLWAGAKGVRIVTYASSLALSFETIGLSALNQGSLVMITALYGCITIALKTAIYWLPSISDVGIVSWVVNFRDLLWCDCCGGLSWRNPACIWSTQMKNEYSEMKAEGNKWRWLRALCEGNKDISLGISTTPTGALNETLTLKSLSIAELHVNLPATLWPASNCREEHPERSEKSTRRLQLDGLHTSIPNRLKMCWGILEWQMPLHSKWTFG